MRSELRMAILKSRTAYKERGRPARQQITTIATAQDHDADRTLVKMNGARCISLSLAFQAWRVIISSP